MRSHMHLLQRLAAVAFVLASTINVAVMMAQLAGEYRRLRTA